jgi:HD-GYP domain-containing protein (c-di-GMP phosphodiesterase class II)
VSDTSRAWRPVHDDGAERGRAAVEFDLGREQVAIPNLAGRLGAHESTELLVDRPAALRRLLLQDAERGEFSLAVDEPLDPVDADRTDQLILEVGHAGEEPESLDLRSAPRRTEAGVLEGAPNDPLLRFVVQPDDPTVGVIGANAGEKVPVIGDAVRRNHLQFAVAGRVEATRQRRDRSRVAVALDEHDRAGRSTQLVDGRFGARESRSCLLPPCAFHRPSLPRREDLSVPTNPHYQVFDRTRRCTFVAIAQPRSSAPKQRWFLVALLAPLFVWVTLRLVPELDIRVLAGEFHLVLMTVVASCALVVAVLAARASSQIRQPGVVLLASGCLVAGSTLLGHGLTTPFVLGQPMNRWVGRLPYLGLVAIALCLALASGNAVRERLAVIGRRPRLSILAISAPPTMLAIFVSIRPTAFHGESAYAWEEDLTLAATVLITALLIPVAVVHWRRFRLGLDIVHLSLSLAAIMITSAVISLHFGQLWRLSWWDYHGCLLAGFAGVAYAVFSRWTTTKQAADVLATAFESDPLTLIAHNYPSELRQLVDVIEIKDPYTHGHSARTAELAVAIGVRMGIEPDDLRTLAQGAYLHDIGKLGIPEEILNKPGSLTPEERRIIETHPTIGFELANVHDVLAPCLPIILHHHERFDGHGYPSSLRGNDIPLLARIAAVADVWDALTSDRSYRPGWEPQRALDHIVDGAGEHLDPRVVAVLLQVAAEAGHRPSGLGGDSANIDMATSDCHEIGDGGQVLTPILHRGG